MASAIYTAHKTAAKQLHQAQMQLLAAFEGVDVITAKLEHAKAAAVSAVAALTLKRKAAAAAELEFDTSSRSLRKG